MMPAWRIAPPICCLPRHASSMNAREPAMAAPTGAPRPLVKSIHTESNGAAYSRAEMPLATTAFMRRAPSRCVESPWRRATAVTAVVHAQRDLVAHRAGRQEDGGFLAQQLGHHLAEEVDRRVLHLLLVAHLGVAHEAAHVGGGAGDGVAVEVDVDSGALGHGEESIVW